MSQRVAAEDRRTLLVIAAALGILAALVVLPYLQYVLAAVVLAYVFYPLQRRLEPRLGRTPTAIGLLVFATVAVLAPVGLLLTVAIEQATELATMLAEGDLGVGSFEERLATIGLEVDLLELYDRLREPIGVAVQGLADQAVGIVGGVPEFLIGLTILLFVLYSLLRDGDRLVGWIGGVLPLRADLRQELFDRVDRLLYVAIVANVAVAAVQALLTTVGLAFVGVSSLAFFFVLTFVLSLLPLIGAAFVWAPVAVYLAVVGRPLAGALLFAYGAVIVSLSDNALRPIAVGRGAQMSVATVVLGIFGGVAVAGVMGLFFGPVVLGAFQTIVELYTRERERERVDVGTEPDAVDELTADSAEPVDGPTVPAEPSSEPGHGPAGRGATVPGEGHDDAGDERSPDDGDDADDGRTVGDGDDADDG